MVADKVIDHIRSMYPDALKAAPASAFTSLRNVTATAAQSAILSAVEAENEACAALASDRWTLWGHKSNDQLCKVDVASCTDIAAAIRNRRNRKGA